MLVCTRLSVDRVLRALLRRLCINGDLNLEETIGATRLGGRCGRYLGASVVEDVIASWVSKKLSVDADVGK